MRKSQPVLLIIVLLFFLSPNMGRAQPTVSANHAILIERDTGNVLFEKNAYDVKPVASITKVMTAIIAIESGQMDEIATTSRRAIYTEGSSIYLEQDRKSTRLNSSHVSISYAVFCLKKKKKEI